MKVVAFAAFAVCLVAAAYGQEPKPCSAPPLWEAAIITEDRDKSFGQMARFSYDAFGRRSRTVEEVYIGNASAQYFDVLNLHDEGKRYVLDLKTKKCNVTALTSPFMPLAVPANATSMGTAYIGAAFEGVLTSFWELRSTDFYWLGEFTEPLCVPVRTVYETNATGRVTTSFFDVTMGIADPNVFIPRKECLA